MRRLCVYSLRSQVGCSKRDLSTELATASNNMLALRLWAGCLACRVHSEHIESVGNGPPCCV